MVRHPPVRRVAKIQPGVVQIRSAHDPGSEAANKTASGEKTKPRPRSAKGLPGGGGFPDSYYLEQLPPHWGG